MNMPASKLADIIPSIEASTDMPTLRASVLSALASCEIPAIDEGGHIRIDTADADRTDFANIVLRIAHIRAMSLPPERNSRLLELGLTERQVEILTWAAKGKSNGDIATILSQSRRAVDYHMSEILRKLGVTSRAQAVALAFTRG